MWGRRRDLGKNEKAIIVLQERSSCTWKKESTGKSHPPPQTLLSSVTQQGYNMQTIAQSLPLEYCGSQNNFLLLPSMKTGGAQLPVYLGMPSRLTRRSHYKQTWQGWWWHTVELPSRARTNAEHTTPTWPPTNPITFSASVSTGPMTTQWKPQTEKSFLAKIHCSSRSTCPAMTALAATDFFQQGKKMSTLNHLNCKWQDDRSHFLSPDMQTPKMIKRVGQTQGLELFLF